MKALPSPEAIAERLDYNPLTGDLVWKPKQNASRNCLQLRAGKAAGNIDDHGYRRITIENQKYWAHRLIWRLMTGEEPDMVDHINGQRDDNRFENLRAADHAQNLQNRGAGKNSKTGVKGVHFHSETGTYRAQIMVRRQRLSLGRFATLEEAAAAYAAAAAQHHGEFAQMA